MKLKHHLWIAFGIIFIALFLTALTSVTEVAGVVERTQSDTTIWSLLYDNFFTSNPTDDLVADLAAMGLDSVTANALIDKYDLGNSVITGLFGLIPTLAVLAGLALVTFKNDTKKWILYTLLGVIIVDVVTVYLTVPIQLDNVEGLFNEIMTGVMPLGTMMKDGTDVTLEYGFFLIIFAALYGIAALVLNKFGKIQD